MTARRRRWIAVAVYCAGIFAASSIPASSMPGPESIWDYDKLIHAGIFAGLAFLLARALGGTWARRFALAVFVATLYGGLDELHQKLTPGRSSDPYDLIADFVGSLAGAGVVAIRGMLRPRHGDPA